MPIAICLAIVIGLFILGLVLIIIIRRSCEKFDFERMVDEEEIRILIAPEDKHQWLKQHAPGKEHQLATRLHL